MYFFSTKYNYYILCLAHVDPAPFVLTTRTGEFIVATQTNKLCIYSTTKNGTQVICLI